MKRVNELLSIFLVIMLASRLVWKPIPAANKVCVCARERQRQRETERESDRERERDVCMSCVSVCLLPGTLGYNYLVKIVEYSQHVTLNFRREKSCTCQARSASRATTLSACMWLTTSACLRLRKSFLKRSTIELPYVIDWFIQPFIHSKPSEIYP